MYADATNSTSSEMYFIQQPLPWSITSIKSFVSMLSTSSFSLKQSLCIRSGMTGSGSPYGFGLKMLWSGSTRWSDEQGFPLETSSALPVDMPLWLDMILILQNVCLCDGPFLQLTAEAFITVSAFAASRLLEHFFILFSEQSIDTLAQTGVEILNTAKMP